MNLCLKGHYFSPNITHIHFSENNSLFIYFGSSDPDTFEYIEINNEELFGNLNNSQYFKLVRLLQR